MQNESSVPVPENTGDNVVFQDKPKKNLGMILGMVLLVILAVGGIVFGVWEMMDGNAQKEELNKQIDVLKEQNSKLLNQTSSTTKQNNGGSSEQSNPIVVATDSADYTIERSLPIKTNDSEDAKVVVKAFGGKVSCYVSGKVGGAFSDECSISGLPEEVYKIVSLYEDGDVVEKKVGFLMTDGSVWYADIYDSDGGLNRNMEAKKLEINGSVKDVIEVWYTPNGEAPIDESLSTVFVLSDNSLMRYGGLASE